MGFPLDDQLLGPRNWGRRPTTAGTIFHTTEYADATRASAVQCARDQSKRTASGGWAQPGSYNGILYDDGEKAGVLITVPPRDASGGINPASPYWNPEAWLRDFLPAEAFRDPTMHHIQWSFSGKAARLADGVKNGTPQAKRLIVLAARLLVWTESRTWAADNQIVSAHVDWQDNRSDPGAGVIDAILEQYEILIAPMPSEPSATDWEAVAADRLATIRRLRKRLAAKEAKINEAREVLERDEP